MTMRKALPLLLSLCLILTACQPIEMSARDAIATAKGYLDSAKQHHPECASGGHSATCDVIARGVAAKDTVADAVNIYCASPSYTDQGGACTPNKDAEPKLKEALKSLSTIMRDVKGIGGVK